MYAADGRWWKVYGARAAQQCRGEFWSGFDRDVAQAQEWRPVPAETKARMQWVDLAPDESGLSIRPQRINAGGNSGYQAIGLAYLWGAARIVLTGYDMQRTGGKAHHHGKHEGGLPNGGDMREWARRMIQLGIDLRERNVHVINATRQTALTCFERMPLERALDVV